MQVTKKKINHKRKFGKVESYSGRAKDFVDPARSRSEHSPKGELNDDDVRKVHALASPPVHYVRVLRLLSRLSALGMIASLSHNQPLGMIDSSPPVYAFDADDSPLRLYHLDTIDFSFSSLLCI